MVNQDRYGRTVGRVFVGPVDVNAELVREGAAWVYRAYNRDPSLLPIEAEARAARPLGVAGNRRDAALGMAQGGTERAGCPQSRACADRRSQNGPAVARTEADKKGKFRSPLFRAFVFNRQPSPLHQALP